MLERFFYYKIKTLNWQEKLENLASTLAKISDRAKIPKQDQHMLKLLREAALIIEWSIPEIPETYHLELTAMQRECVEWYWAYPVEQARNILAMHSQNQSDRILQISGLLTSEAPAEQLAQS